MTGLVATDPAVRISRVEYEQGLGLVHRQVIPAFTELGFLTCPRCSAEVHSRANYEGDTEPDWWDCVGCGATGAFLHPNWPGVTQNGHPLIGFSRLF